jgi:hypothetical protein
MKELDSEIILPPKQFLEDVAPRNEGNGTNMPIGGGALN